jgi:hypothetical protein
LEYGGTGLQLVSLLLLLVGSISVSEFEFHRERGQTRTISR